MMIPVAIIWTMNKLLRYFQQRLRKKCKPRKRRSKSWDWRRKRKIKNWQKRDKNSKKSRPKDCRDRNNSSVSRVSYRENLLMTGIKRRSQLWLMRGRRPLTNKIMEKKKEPALMKPTAREMTLRLKQKIRVSSIKQINRAQTQGSKH